MAPTRSLVSIPQLCTVSGSRSLGRRLSVAELSVGASIAHKRWVVAMTERLWGPAYSAGFLCVGAHVRGASKPASSASVLGILLIGRPLGGGRGSVSRAFGGTYRRSIRCRRPSREGNGGLGR